MKSFMKVDSGIAGEARAIGGSLHISGPRVLVPRSANPLLWVANGPLERLGGQFRATV